VRGVYVIIIVLYGLTEIECTRTLSSWSPGERDVECFN
jgi:hypothetical protein